MALSTRNSEFIDLTGNLPPEVLSPLDKAISSDSWTYSAKPCHADNNGFVIILAEGANNLLDVLNKTVTQYIQLN